ncbi:MAG TPA: hypothetical protein DCF68_14550, partial [Cyanothece sp. UBA12306]|nr:hypothetical protein [Cyanothece sp. UBA12306]
QGLLFDRSQKSEVVFVTRIYASLQKLFAFKSQVLDPIISINTNNANNADNVINKDNNYWEQNVNLILKFSGSLGFILSIYLNGYYKKIRENIEAYNIDKSE